jgi:ABC-2 type transport system ATP-binding protein
VAAIETAGLTKRYGDVTAVDDLTFSVRDGAVTGFLGPNGAGKTTTLRMILALARPTAGHATVKGRPYRELEHPARTVGANLEIAGAHPGRKGRDHLRALAGMASLPRSRVDEVLRLVELEGAAGRRAGKYSLGMRQRLGLAATLLGDPEVLILDEPANGLDPQGIRWLRDFLRGMASEGRTVLVSSHVLAEVAQTVDDVVVIHRGRLVDQGPVSRLTAGGHVVARSPRAGELRDPRDRRRRPGPGGRPRVRGRDPAARADHARHLARGGLPGADGRRGGRAVIPLVQGEMIKVRTTRTALGFGLASVLLVLAVVLITILAGDPDTVQEKKDALNLGGALCIPLLLFGIVGATGEYRHRTLAPAVLIAPDRMRLALARLVAYVFTALAVGAAMAAVALVIGVPLLASQPGPDLEFSDYRTIVGGGLITAMLVTALGVGVGMVVKNQVAGVVGALVWLFILEPLIPLIDDWLVNVSILGAAATLGGASPDEVSWGEALLVLSLWAAVFVAAGLAFERRRDVD